MPIYDVQCNSCRFTEEVYAPPNQEDFTCSRCGKDARKIITLGRNHAFEDNPVWIQSVLDVVEKDSGKPHCERFLKEPTRANYKTWMKGEGIRPMEREHGAFRTEIPEPVEPDMKPIIKDLIQKKKKRERIEVWG